MQPVASRSSLRDFIDTISWSHDGIGRPDLDIKCVITDLIAGLEWIHRHRVRHRDIKPENILLDDSKEKAIYTDFGISLDLEALPSSTTNTKNPIYSHAYGAPELLWPTRKGRTHKSDVFSLGCVFFELFAFYWNVSPMKDYTIYDTGFTAYGDAVRSATLNKVFKTFETPPEKGLEGLHVDKYWMCWIRAMVECQPHLRPSAKQLLMHHICALSGSGVWKRVLFREVNDIKISLACHGINLVMTDEVLHRAWKTLKRPRISWLLCQVFHARN